MAEWCACTLLCFSMKASVRFLLLVGAFGVNGGRGEEWQKWDGTGWA